MSFYNFSKSYLKIIKIVNVYATIIIFIVVIGNNDIIRGKVKVGEKIINPFLLRAGSLIGSWKQSNNFPFYEGEGKIHPHATNHA